MNFFKNLFVKFTRFFAIDIDWKFWEVAYDFGANKKFYEIGEFCKCKHRLYNHTKQIDQITSPYGVFSEKGCSVCGCINFSLMDQFQFIEYAREWKSVIEKRSAYGYDYARAVEKGYQIRP